LSIQLLTDMLNFAKIRKRFGNIIHSMGDIMRYLTVVAGIWLFMCVFNQAFGDEDEQYHFRKTKWGMSQSEIIDAEDSKPEFRNERRMAFMTEVLDKKMAVEYFSAGDKLCRAGYTLMERYLNENRYVADYMDFKKILYGKYGEPIEDRTVWRNDFFKNNSSQWGVAVSAGYLSFFSTWETDDTIISASLTGGDFNVACVVVYKSKKLIHLENQMRETGDTSKPDGLSAGDKKREKKLRKAMDDF